MRYAKSYLLASCLLFQGCFGNITPVTRERQTVSFSGNDQTAGIVQFLPDGSLEITPAKFLQYDTLTHTYGSKIKPEVVRAFGTSRLPNGNYSITKEGMEKFYALYLYAEEVRIRKTD